MRVLTDPMEGHFIKYGLGKALKQCSGAVVRDSRATTPGGAWWGKSLSLQAALTLANLPGTLNLL